MIESKLNRGREPLLYPMSGMRNSADDTLVLNPSKFGATVYLSLTRKIKMSTESHPGRYPVHSDPLKGQVHGGECNITKCHWQNAVLWNTITYGLYCPACAKEVNWRAEICVKVDEKPTIDEMDVLYKHSMATLNF